MAEAKAFTTRVYKYGAIPLGLFPKEGVDQLFRANQLWNKLVEINNEHAEYYDQARRDVDEEYNTLSVELDNVEDRVKKAFTGKRNARMKASSRDADHPLVKTANDKIDTLFAERRELWDGIKQPRSRADKVIDKDVLNTAFNTAVKEAKRSDNTDGLDSNTANEVWRYFKEARGKVFQNPRSKLRFHRFDGMGYRFYRFRDRLIKTNKDGVSFEYFSRRGGDDDRAFLLTPSAKEPSTRDKRRGVQRYHLKLKVAGGHSKASKVYAEFDLLMHRPIPDGAQINNAKLMRIRTGDRFKYTVNFSVRVPVAEPAKPKAHAIGVDIGFRRLEDGSIRAATIAGTSSDFETLSVGLDQEYLDRIEHIESLQAKMDERATELGKKIKPLLKAGAVLAEDHPRQRFVKRIASAPSNVTMSLEQAYKLGSWLKNNPTELPKAVVEPVFDWWDHNAKHYREMHNLRRKTLAWRKEEYRFLAHGLVGHGLPIGIEAIDLSTFAEVKDKDNKLRNKALSQRFLVSNSELIGAIKNAAQREGVPVIEVPAPYTSKTCSACGNVHKELKAELEWDCPECGVVHDRDENAAVNIARSAVKKMAPKKPKALAAE
jgi:transposase